MIQPTTVGAKCIRSHDSLKRIKQRRSSQSIYYEHHWPINRCISSRIHVQCENREKEQIITTATKSTNSRLQCINCCSDSLVTHITCRNQIAVSFIESMTHMPLWVAFSNRKIIQKIYIRRNNILEIHDSLFFIVSSCQLAMLFCVSLQVD